MAEYLFFDFEKITPGVMRDNTAVSSNYYSEMVWCRSYNGKPRKMGGRKLISPGNTNIIRNLFNYPTASGFNLVYGRQDSLKEESFSNDGLGGTEYDRTPISFPANANNIWNFDSLTTLLSLTPTSIVYAHAAPNLLEINNTVETPVYYGVQGAFTPYVGMLDNLGNPVTANGGLCVTGGFVMIYTDGTVKWNNLSDATVIHEDNYSDVAGSKIIQGLPINGGGVPSALFFTANKLIKATYDVQSSLAGTPPLPVFNFENVPGNMSILSQNSVISANNMFFWIGNDGNFYVYTGVLQTLPNFQNKKWFFRNLNYTYRNKIWGIYIAENDELWWFFPYGDSTECNWAIIFNKTEKTWYDTPLSRSSGVSASTFNYPIMCDSSPRDNLSVIPPSGQAPEKVYSVWQHEFGNDEIFYKFTYPITFSFTTKYFDLREFGGKDLLMQIERFEPDSQSTGQMQIQVITRLYSQSPDVISNIYYFDQNTTKVDTREQGRYIAFKITNNDYNGFYQMGSPTIFYTIGDVVP